MRSILFLILITGTVAAEDLAKLPVLFTEDFEKGHGRWQTTDAESWTHRKVEGNAVFGINRRNSNYQPKVRSPRHIALIKDVQVAAGVTIEAGAVHKGEAITAESQED